MSGITPVERAAMRVDGQKRARRAHRAEGRFRFDPPALVGDLRHRRLLEETRAGA